MQKKHFSVSMELPKHSVSEVVVHSEIISLPVQSEQGEQGA